MVDFVSDQFPFVGEGVLEKIKELYPRSTQLPSHGAFFSAAANAYGEITFICPGIFINEQINKYLPGKSYNYQ